MLAGSLWSWVFPINKNLWTSSYVVFTAGFACVVLATCLWIIDVHQVRGWTKPFVVYGVNPLVAFVGSGLMARTIDSLFKVNDRREEDLAASGHFDAVLRAVSSPKSSRRCCGGSASSRSGSAS